MTEQGEIPQSPDILSNNEWLELEVRLPTTSQQAEGPVSFIEDPVTAWGIYENTYQEAGKDKINHIVYCISKVDLSLTIFSIHLADRGLKAYYSVPLESIGNLDQFVEDMKFQDITAELTSQPESLDGLRGLLMELRNQEDFFQSNEDL